MLSKHALATKVSSWLLTVPRKPARKLRDDGWCFFGGHARDIIGKLVPPGTIREDTPSQAGLEINRVSRYDS